jgi:hypothetical protein
MIPDDDNPELTKFMVAMRFAGREDFATLPREERQARDKAMMQLPYLKGQKNDFCSLVEATRT